MPVYTYKGQDENTGKAIKGSLEAESARDAKIRLKSQKIIVLSLIEDNKTQAATENSSLFATLNRKPPTLKDIALATKQLSILLNAAVDINDALRVIAEQVANLELKHVYLKIRELLSEGNSLANAHAQFPKIFDPIYINMLAAAQRSGSLALIMQRLSSFIYYQIDIKKKLVNALSYPILMILMAIAVVLYLFIKILPNMTKSFSSLKVILPWYTILMNQFSAWLQQWWLVCISCVIGSICLIFTWSKTVRGREKIDYFFFHAPIIGILVQKITISRFTKTLATILASGVRIVEALELSKKVVGNSVMENALSNALVKVQDGDKLSTALEKTGCFPTMTIHMLRTGEKTGKIEDILVNIAQIYDEDVDSQISTTTKLIEPIIMLFMAVIVFIMVMAVIGPMMAAMNQLH